MFNEQEKKANTFILGAPKCGTTSLSTWLAAHPEVFFSKEKEPHYFYSPYHVKKKEQEYRALFNGANDGHKVLAEASVWYLFSQTAVQKIMQYNPNSKVVVCLRNPIDMAVSLHAQAIVNNGAGYEDTLSFSKAWSYSDRRFSGGRVGLRGPKFDTKILAYKQACFLGGQLQTVLQQVPAESSHVVVMDDLEADPRVQWVQLQQFLGLQDDGREDFSVVNVATAPKSFQVHKFLNRVGWLKQRLGIKKSFNLLAGVHNKNIALKAYEKPTDTLYAEMQESFHDDIKLLEKLLKRDLSAWMKPRS